MLKIADLHWNRKSNKGYPECAEFLVMLRKLPGDLPNRFYFPNRAAAPWHLQARVGGSIIDVWPHKKKWRIGGTKAIEGRGAWISLDNMLKMLYAEEQDEGTAPNQDQP